MSDTDTYGSVSDSRYSVVISASDFDALHTAARAAESTLRQLCCGNLEELLCSLAAAVSATRVTADQAATVSAAKRWHERCHGNPDGYLHGLMTGLICADRVHDMVALERKLRLVTGLECEARTDGESVDVTFHEPGGRSLIMRVPGVSA